MLLMNPSIILSTSKFVKPCCWLLSLSNYLKSWTNFVLFLVVSGNCVRILDREIKLSSVNLSALISKEPTSGKVTPLRINLSESPILYLFTSMFFLIVLRASLKAIELATSAKAVWCFKETISSFLLSYSVRITTWFSSSVYLDDDFLSLCSRFWIFFSSSTIWFSFSLRRFV